MTDAPLSADEIQEWIQRAQEAGILDEAGFLRLVSESIVIASTDEEELARLQGAAKATGADFTGCLLSFVEDVYPYCDDTECEDVAYAPLHFHPEDGAP